jgi:hypothetical protein
MKITKINLNPDGGSYYVVFIDDKLLMEGDEYHDKINAQIQGIVHLCVFESRECSVEEVNARILDAAEDAYYDDKFAPKPKDSVEKYLKRLSKDFKISRD